MTIESLQLGVYVLAFASFSRIRAPGSPTLNKL